MKKYTLHILCVLFVLLTPACSQTDMWYIHMQDSAETDIFYVCSTETSDWINEQGDTMHFADMNRPEHRAALYGEMHGVDSLICPKTCNFYAPYYNQATLEGLLWDTTLFRPRCAQSTKEVKQAFAYYMRHFNQGRRFVLMGYSQGAFTVVELLKSLTPEETERMVAAYVIGYQVTTEDLTCPSIRPAQSETDTGVTVCFNSVSSVNAAIPILSGNTAIGINPVNWETDATSATYLFDFAGACDTLTATLDTLSHLTIIRGYKGFCPQVPFCGREGNYHCMEIPLYYRFLKENVAARIQGIATDEGR